MDVEGAEFNILKSIPWDKINIDAVSIEADRIGELYPGTLAEVRSFMFSQGFMMYQKTGIDDIFVKKSLLKTFQIEQS